MTSANFEAKTTNFGKFSNQEGKYDIYVVKVVDGMSIEKYGKEIAHVSVLEKKETFFRRCYKI